jgi:hypothetical protein
LFKRIHFRFNLFNFFVMKPKSKRIKNDEKENGSGYHYSPLPDARLREAARPALFIAGCTGVALANLVLTLIA